MGLIRLQRVCFSFALFISFAKIALPIFIEHTSSAGKLIGIQENIQGVTLNSFLGIPYAEPPINEKRFSRPVLKEPWSGLFNATEQPHSCVQSIDSAYDRFSGVEMWNPNTKRSEDCLYLNIHVPKTNSNKKRAVVIWIYGGSFAFGTISLGMYDGRIMSSAGDVIFVAMQYRLGPLGFLYLSEHTAPGNMGLLDQNVALQWVHKHIDSFGGDINHITLFGESAGADCASLHQISPLSRHMVNNVILQSASYFAKWGVDPPEYAHSQALKLAGSLNCHGSDEEILTCLKSIDAQVLTDKMWDMGDNKHVALPFLPTIDNHFLTECPRDTLPDIELSDSLIGYNANEGSYFMLYEGFVKTLDHTQRTKSEFLNNLTHLLNTDQDELIKLVTFEYESKDGEYSFEKNYLEILDNILGDKVFTCSIVNYGDRMTTLGNNVYMYLFNHRTSANPWPQWTGVMHGYEIDHVFGAPLNHSINYSQLERQLSGKVLKYWTNFAKSGNPNLEEVNGKRSAELDHWPVYGSQKKSLVLDTNQPMNVVQGHKQRKCKFWKEIYPAFKTLIDATSDGKILQYSSKMLTFSLFWSIATHCLGIFI